MAIPLDLLNFVDQDHPVMVAYRMEHYPWEATGLYKPVDPTLAVEHERHEEEERERENVQESLGGGSVGSGDPQLEEQGGSDEFRRLSGKSADYHSVEEIGGLVGDVRDEGVEVEKDVETPRPKRFKTLARTLSKTDMVRPLPFSWDTTEDEPSHSSIACPLATLVLLNKDQFHFLTGRKHTCHPRVHLEHVEISHVQPPMTLFYSCTV